MSIENEDELMGAMVLNRGIVDEVSALLSADEFSDENRGAAFQIIVDARAAKIPIETELRRFVRSGKTLLDMSWLTRVLSGLACDYTYHIGEIKKAAHRRALVPIIEVASRALDQESREDPQNIENDIRNELDRIGSKHGGGGVAMPDACDRLALRLAKPDSSRPVYSGLVDLDESIGGFRPGQLVVLGGRPGTGKSALALQIAVYNSTKGNHVSYITFEMTTDELLERLACGRSGIDSRLIHSGELSPSSRSRLLEEIDRMRELPITFWDRTGVTMPQLAGMASIDVRRFGAKLLVVDYLGLIERTDPKQSTYAHISDTTRKLKNLAGELKIPILLLCQLNREADGKRPTLASLRDSGSIEQDANIVMFTHSENEQNYILVEKNRSGDTGAVEVIFDKRATTFRDANTITAANPLYPSAEVQTSGSRWVL